ncbi:MAG: class I tRNA ligase family protein, partial [Bacteroidota bacterium]|nr:class I tRNA ligase family protein [Bacteroidota bacterium]
KHNLEIVDTLNDDGTLSEAAQVFVGLDRFEARKKAIEKLKQDGLIIKEEEYTTRLGFSQRTNAVVEPRISTQWFVKMKELAGPALKEVTEGRIKIHPGEKFLATYKYWLENAKDWCISRQLWWGQRIPAWYDDEGNIFVAETEQEAKKQAASRELRALGNNNPKPVTRNPNLSQDEDVLDTWFSSWLWPIEVFKGITNPNNKDINYYYPVSVLVTGQDIIFFWVARMIMAGMEYMNKKPFNDVYFTGMVRDKQGRKMSKQLGNSPDLLDLIDQFGADAVRFGIMISSPAGNDLLFDESSCEQGKFFNNKLWNALKLVRSWESRIKSSESGKIQNSELRTQNFAVNWFENRLNEVRSDVEKLYKDFRLSEALKTIYSLIWDDFCSWYLEWVKPGFEEPIDANVYNKSVDFFEQLVQLLHPFMPFITEEIYHQLKERTNDLTVNQFPSAASIDEKVLKNGNLLKEAITAIRDAKNKNHIKPKDVFELYIETGESELYKTFEDILSKQVNAEKTHYTLKAENGVFTVVGNNIKFHIKTNQQIDTTLQKDQLQKNLDYLKGFLVSVEKKLGNQRFVQNAKPEIIETERKKKADAEEKIKAIEESLKELN